MISAHPKFITPKTSHYDELDVNRCGSCGASGVRNVKTVRAAVQWGRLCLRYRVCTVCGWGRNSEAVSVSFVLTGNPAGIAAVEAYMAVAESVGEEEVERE
jgi:hypothetical protein